MTTIDNLRRPGNVPNVPGSTLDHLDALSVATGRTPAELVRIAVAEFPLPAYARPSAGAVSPNVLTPSGGRFVGAELRAVPAPRAAETA